MYQCALARNSHNSLTDAVSEEKGRQTGIIAGSAAAGTLVALVAIGFGWYWHKQKMKRNTKSAAIVTNGDGYNSSPDR